MPYMTEQFKSNKQLFIIGNGFDIAHNLETSYQDFYYYLLRNDSTVAEQCLLNLLTNQIRLRDKNSDVIWSNFEEFLGDASFDSDIEMTSEYDMDQSDKDADYYDYQVNYNLKEEQCIAESLPSIFAKWISTIEVTEAEGKEGFIRLIQDTSEFLTFNYTRTLEEVYNVFSPCHIHGTIDEDGENDGILVGHGSEKLEQYTYATGDKNPLGEFSSIAAIEEGQNRARTMYNSWRKDVAANLYAHTDFFKRLHNIHTIYSYGFSYGSIDMPYIRAIIQSLGESEKVHWLLESYDEGANKVYEERIREAGFKGMIGQFSPEPRGQVQWLK